MFSTNLAELHNATLGHLLARSGRLIQEATLQRLHKQGHPEIRPRWIEVLRHLENGPIRQGLLASKMKISKQATHKLAQELESHSYVEITLDPSDGRARLIKVTQKGLRMWTKGLREMQKIERKIQKDFSAAKIKKLKTLSLSLLQTLESQQFTP